MLNIPLIQHAMQQQGLNQSELASRCGVSREAVSRWLAGESIPRPFKLKQIADIFELSIESLLITAPPPSFETSPGCSKEALSREVKEHMLDTSWRLRELASQVALFNDASKLTGTVQPTKAELLIPGHISKGTQRLVELNIAAGAVLLPCPWRGDRDGQALPFVVQPSAEDGIWVVFGLCTSRAALDSILAYALGLQYCRGLIDGPAAREFAAKFASAILSYGAAGSVLGAETVADMYFQGATDVLTPKFIAQCESIFATPAYHAIEELQRQDGGRNPAFIASLLNVGLGEAVTWSYVLYDRAKARAGAVRTLSSN